MLFILWNFDWNLTETFKYQINSPKGNQTIANLRQMSKMGLFLNFEAQNLETIGMAKHEAAWIRIMTHFHDSLFDHNEIYCSDIKICFTILSKISWH